VLRPEAQADHARRDPAQPRPGVEQAQREWNPQRRARERRRDHVLLREDLQPLGEPGRQLAATLHRAQLVGRRCAAAKRGGQQVRRRDRVLDREVDPDAADRRHRVRGIADAEQPGRAHSRSRSIFTVRSSRRPSRAARRLGRPGTGRADGSRRAATRRRPSEARPARPSGSRMRTASSHRGRA
jgi:hypothetical protein